MRDLVRPLADDRPTVMISSRLLSEAQQACDWLVMIKDGAAGVPRFPPRNCSPAGRRARARLPAPRRFLPRLSGLLRRRSLTQARDGSRPRVPSRQSQADLERPSGLSDQIAEISKAAMAGRLTLAELTITPASLEDRYETLMAEGARRTTPCAPICSFMAADRSQLHEFTLAGGMPVSPAGCWDGDEPQGSRDGSRTRPSRLLLDLRRRRDHPPT
jgi:hypothetical protein